jgi:U3 small nucleolar RNA-associated protein 5
VALFRPNWVKLFLAPTIQFMRRKKTAPHHRQVFSEQSCFRLLPLPGRMPRHSRKAEEALANEPAAKKLRTHTNTNTSEPHDLKSALFTNGKLKAGYSNPTHNSTKTDETNATISKPLGHGNIPIPHIEVADVIVISSDHSSTDSSDDDDEAEVNGTAHQDQEDDDDSDSDKENEVAFGDLVPESTIDVETLLKSDTAVVSQATSQNTLVPPSSTTLSTVLSQALRTNDSQLLESCLLLNDLSAVRGTISRLPSGLAEALLSALASRLHARPGRANNLMVWLQWTIVAHGGYLAGKKGLVAKLGALQRVVRERAMGLAPLLELKGKLDMLSAQMELRRLAGAGKDDEEDDEMVIYVEDEEDSPADDEDESDEDDEDVAEGAVAEDTILQHGSSDDSDSSGDDESDSGSEASSKGFSDAAVEEDSGSDEEDSDDEPSIQEFSKKAGFKKSRR